MTIDPNPDSPEAGPDRREADRNRRGLGYGYGYGYKKRSINLKQSVFVPTLLFALAINIGMAIQTLTLTSEHRQLKDARSSQDASIANSTKMRDSLGKVVAATAKAAIDESANAKLIADELRKNGVSITSIIDTVK